MTQIFLCVGGLYMCAHVYEVCFLCISVWKPEGTVLSSSISLPLKWLLLTSLMTVSCMYEVQSDCCTLFSVFSDLLLHCPPTHLLLCHLHISSFTVTLHIISSHPWLCCYLARICTAMGLEHLLVPGGHSVGTQLKAMTVLPQNPPVDSISAGNRDRPISTSLTYDWLLLLCRLLQTAILL